MQTFCSLFVGSIRFNQTIVTVLPTVYQINFAGVIVAEHEKVVSQQFHLQYCLFGTEWLDRDFFGFDNTQLLLVLYIHLIPQRRASKEPARKRFSNLLIALFCLALMIAPSIIIPLVILAHQKKRKKQDSGE